MLLTISLAREKDGSLTENNGIFMLEGDSFDWFLQHYEYSIVIFTNGNDTKSLDLITKLG